MRHIKHSVYLWLLGCIIFGSCISDHVEPEKPNRGFTVVVGQQAPAFTITYLDGTTASLSSLKGKVVMLQFAASWCPVCQKVMPIIEKEIWQPYKNNPDFALIGSCKSENRDAVLHIKSNLSAHCR